MSDTLLPPKVVLSASLSEPITIEAGDSGRMIRLYPGSSAPMFQVLETCGLLIERTYDNRLALSTKIRDETGIVVGEIERNEWRLDPPPTRLDRNFTSDAIEIVDAYGNVVLQAKMLPDRVQLQGKWRISAGRWVVLAKAPRINDSTKPALILAVVPHPDIVRIVPMFKYPSKDHFGELVSAR